ncbi:hypothetical protein IE81DRAFT_333998 [Ceraceosorus guamensis]|uniref:Alpha-ketoglutarate-dependent dioxygenase AlkB-like domain-containing protein n=1 Tax=Ceraceosorus guamensis TaxID=1522189 RepID=A0A316W574_9BASI|nr:hypothetical protein IE81DRAFT_333998 [Ceraceosorus guamensis]PWN43851.1 hypothetical protein IE81DRAFT_333998 [Ceraceosorus guamensis]
MLFGRGGTDLPSDVQRERKTCSGIPRWAQSLLKALQEKCEHALPKETCAVLFDPVKRARQLILNLYEPGAGIASHIDLAHRFDDGIFCLSLGSGVVMSFARSDLQPVQTATGTRELSIWLPPRSLLVLTGKARWQYAHGIEARPGDWVSDQRAHSHGMAAAQVRLSITGRWLKQGADVVGGG